MSGLNALTGQIAAAQNLPELLGAAYEAFEVMLRVIREHDQPGADFFLPMVMAGAAAGNGRDHLLFAPSLPPRSFDPPGALLQYDLRMTVQEAVDWLAGVCQVMVYAETEGLNVYDPSDQSLPFNPLAPAVDPRSGRVNPTHHVHQLTDIVKRIYHLGDQQAYRLREALAGHAHRCPLVPQVGRRRHAPAGDGRRPNRRPHVRHRCAYPSPVCLR